MSKTAVLQRSYALGERSDLPPTQLPEGALYRLTDYLPQQFGAPLRKRGGWVFQHTGTGTGNYAIAAVYAPQMSSGSARLIFQTDAGNAYDVIGGSLSAIAGLTTRPSYRPIFYQGVVFFPVESTNLGYYDGATVSSIVSAPNGGYGTIWRDFVVVGHGADGKIYFSPPGSPWAGWDTANSWVQMPTGKLYSLATVRNTLLGFDQDVTYRWRGSTPPSLYSVGDMVSDVAWDMGCTDDRSVTSWGEQLIFCNPQGIWLTDGVSLENIAEGGGILRQWISQLSGYNPATWVIATGVLSGHLFVSIVQNPGASAVIKGGWACNLSRRSWYRISNLPAAFFARRHDTSERLYFANAKTGRVGEISSFFSPAAGVKADGDGTAILPSIETGFYQDRPGMKRWLRLFANYQLITTDDATFQVSYTTDTLAGYTVLGTLPASGSRRKGDLPLRFDSEHVQFKIAQTAASSDTYLYEIEAALEALEQSRVR
jgi:hypothetical protein